MPRRSKIDRMQQHVMDSCMTKYGDEKRCNEMSQAVVFKYRQRHQPVKVISLTIDHKGNIGIK